MHGREKYYLLPSAGEALINVEVYYSIANDDKSYCYCPDYTGFSNAVVDPVVQASSGAALRMTSGNTNTEEKKAQIRSVRKYRKATEEKKAQIRSVAKYRKARFKSRKKLKWCHTVVSKNTGSSNEGRDPRIRLIDNMMAVIQRPI